MKRNLTGLIVLVLLALGIGIYWHVVTGAPKKAEVIPWRTDFAAARAEAERLHRPLFMDFTASWCPPCQQMARTTWTDPAVAAALKDIIPVKIDLDQNHELAQQYDVQSIPAFRMVDSKGTVLKSGGGLMTSEQFLAWLKQKPAIPGTTRPE